MKLGPGDRLLIASDGLLDATSKAGEVLGEEGLATIMRTNRATSGIGLLEAMVWSVLAYTGGRQEDDISALLIEHLGQSA